MGKLLAVVGALGIVSVLPTGEEPVTLVKKGLPCGKCSMNLLSSPQIPPLVIPIFPMKRRFVELERPGKNARGSKSQMNSLVFLAIAAGSSYAKAVSLNFFGKKKAALARACELVNNKGIINLGAGYRRSAFAKYVCTLEIVRVNVDIVDGAPKMLVADLEEPLPFPDEEFDVAFASHVLEHLNHWRLALDEWTRIADHVVVVLPHPLSIGGRLAPNHRHHFSLSDMGYISQVWPSVEVFA